MSDDTAATILSAITPRGGAPDLQDALTVLDGVPQPDRWAAVRGEDGGTAFLQVGGVEFVLESQVSPWGTLEVDTLVRLQVPV